MSAGSAPEPARSEPTPLDLPLDRAGTTFIEASAGTGKTHALTTLVARLIIEEGWSIDRILVVTFTRAATAELRDRIRRVLAMLLDAVRARRREAVASQGWESSAGSPDQAGPLTPVGLPASADLPGSAGLPAPAGLPDPAGLPTSVAPPDPAGSPDRGAPAPAVDSRAHELLAAWGDRAGDIDFALAARRLEGAMHDIDRANVFTIHGFCQRVLADLAFESGLSFGCEVGGDGGEAVAAAVRDFWRRRMYPSSALLMRHAVGSGFLPRALAGWVSSRRAKIGAEVVGGDPPASRLEACEAAWRDVYDAVRSQWESERDTFRAEILEGPWLNRQRYRMARSKAELDALDALFSAAGPRLPAEGAACRYGREQLARACRKGGAVPDHPLFDAFDRLEDASAVLRAEYDQWLRWARAEALAEVRQSVRRRVRTDRTLAWDDLPIELDHALGSAGGARLAARIRHEFPCALIDEYQDTDPVQARIFSRIYAHPGPSPAASSFEPESGLSRERHPAAVPFPQGAVTSKSEPEAISAPDPAPPGHVMGPRGFEPEPEAISAPDPAPPGHVTGPRGLEPEPEAISAPDPAPPGHVTGPRGLELERGGISDPDAAWPGHDTRSRGLESEPGEAPTRDERARRGPFIVVGDPKQSIYRFRGADVFAYLAARRSATARLHLDRNWRSTSRLVEAVNALFSGAAPFVTAGIDYRAVAAAREAPDPLRIAGQDAPVPFEFQLLLRGRDGKALAKKEVEPVVAGAVADEIARLLVLAARGEAVVEDRPLAGADLAVLVRTREQGRVMAEALRERGVRSIEIDDGSVFHTREAEQLERLLWALADPGREPQVRGALASDLFGLDAPALYALGEDEPAWSAWAQRREDWRAHWESRGIGSLLLRLFEGEGGAKHLLRHPDGTRRLTNYRHLAELLQAAETRDRLATSELAAWLNRRRTDPDGRDEEAKLRIESDERLVRILTMHGSKGLEFPVVFCPFAWDARGPDRRSDAVDAVHHRGAAEDYREVIDLAPDERAAALERLEEFAESVRLFYVAVTRAKYRCVVAWGQVRGAEHAPLAWLLHRSAGGQSPITEPKGGGAAGAALRSTDEQPPLAEPAGGGVAGAALRSADGQPLITEPAEGDVASTAPQSMDGPPPIPEPAGGDAASTPPQSVDGPPPLTESEGNDAAIAALAAVADRFRGLEAGAWRGEVEAFARRVPGAVAVSVLDPESSPARPPEGLDGPLPALAARALRRPLRRIRSLTSFSALWAEAGAATPAGAAGARTPASRDEAEIDRPDHDQHETPAGAAGDPRDMGGAAAGERTAFTFPRGPVAGSCLHRIFERLDESPDLAGNRTDLDAICDAALADFGIDGVWKPVARAMVENTRAVRLREPEAARMTEPSHTAASGAERERGHSTVMESRSGGSDGQAPAPTFPSGRDSTGGSPDASFLGTKFDPQPEVSLTKGAEGGAGSERAIVTADLGAGRAAGNNGFRLGDPHRRLVELEFHFPVEGLDRSRLASRLVEHGYPDPFVGPAPNRAGGTGRSGPPLHGFLRGYVDLVVEHGQRWYVVDYKSNWLGPEPGDYAPEALAASMHAGGYTLQSLIYLVALHRYLATRLPDYEYERHVGGAFYLFVRGIEPTAGLRRGVYFDRPAAECLRALDDCFRGGGA